MKKVSYRNSDGKFVSKSEWLRDKIGKKYSFPRVDRNSDTCHETLQKMVELKNEYLELAELSILAYFNVSVTGFDSDGTQIEYLTSGDYLRINTTTNNKFRSSLNTNYTSRERKRELFSCVVDEVNNIVKEQTKIVDFYGESTDDSLI